MNTELLLGQMYMDFTRDVCESFNVPEAYGPLAKGFDALMESRRLYAGKTLRDQNNYDRKFRWNDESDKNPQTMGLTTSKYGFHKDVSAGKGSRQYDLGRDGVADTGKNYGISKVGRRAIKRFQDREDEKAMNADLDDMMRTDAFDGDAGYQPMSRTQMKGVDPNVFKDPDGSKLGDFDASGLMTTAAKNNESSLDHHGLTQKGSAVLDQLDKVFDKKLHLSALLRKAVRRYSLSNNSDVDGAIRRANELLDEYSGRLGRSNLYDRRDGKASKDNPMKYMDPSELDVFDKKLDEAINDLNRALYVNDPSKKNDIMSLFDDEPYNI